MTAGSVLSLHSAAAAILATIPAQMLLLLHSERLERPGPFSEAQLELWAQPLSSPSLGQTYTGGHPLRLWVSPSTGAAGHHLLSCLLPNRKENLPRVLCA